MKISEAIRLAGLVEKGNVMEEELAVLWLAELDGMIQSDIMLHAPEEIVSYSSGEDELLLKPPHDKLYVHYLVMMIRQQQQEYEGYQNAQAIVDEKLKIFRRWYVQHYRPADSLSDNGAVSDPGTWGFAYITAYGLAVQQGYRGTLDEWLESLKGETGEAARMRYDEERETVQWGVGEQWYDLFTLSELRDPVVDAIIAQATDAAADALGYAEDAEVQAKAAAGSAQAAADSADEAARAADEAGNAAANAVSQAGAAADSAAQAEESAQAANQAYVEAERMTAHAEDAREAAETAAEEARTAAEEAKNATGTGGGGPAYVAAEEPPENTKAMWVDTSEPEEAVALGVTAVETAEGVDLYCTDELGTTKVSLRHGKVELDTTLTQSGKAADAKAVGDALTELEAKIPESGGGTTDYTALSNKPKINGVELSGNKTAEDLGIGQPTDEQVAAGVEQYIEKNPGAVTTVADGSITPAKTTFLHARVNNLIDVTKIVSGHQTANGIPAGSSPSGAGWTTDLIPVEPGKTYSYNGSTGTSGMWTSWFYDSDTNPLSAVPGSPCVAPEGAAYIRITYMAQPTEVGLWEGSNPMPYDQGVQYHEFDEMTEAAIQHLVEAYPQVFRVAPKNLYKFLSTGSVNGTTGKIGYPGNMNVSDYIRVTPGQQYVSNCFAGIQYAACYDANKEFVASFTDSTEKRWDENILFFTIINPAVRYIVVATSTSESIETRYITPGDAVPESLDGNIVVMDDPALLAAVKSVLGIDGAKSMSGQLTVGLGDSNTNAEVNANNWLTVLEALLGVTTINYGVSGETVVDMCARYAQMDADAQNIIVAAGVNDITKGTTLGAVGNTTTETFYGALYVLLTGLLDRYPGKRILYVTPINYGEAETEEPYINAICTMCGRFAVPVIDMWHSGGPVSAVTEALSNLNTTDGLHFTAGVHAAIARRVAEQLQKM